MIHTSAPASRGGTKAACEKTKVRHPDRWGSRKSHASSVNELAVSEPMWHRQATRAPYAMRCGAIPAVCGSCRKTMSSRWILPSRASMLARRTAE